MQEDLAQQAIQAAVSGNWKTAENLNRTILDNNASDIDALLRLANALFQLGKKKDATNLYEQVLKVDKFNVFANRGLDRLKKAKPNGIVHHSLETLFLEEPGKTKTVGLVYIAGPQVVAGLDSGERVLLVSKRHRIAVTTASGVYIGRLPDNLSVRILSFMAGGNRYEAVIKCANTEEVKVFIKETSRSQKFIQTPTFPHEGPMQFSEA
ncbi:hypothetical protein HYZ78_04120 [Candidatus Microgenomates bacterium]|nr:hypothetical protein [Candidatus Microgenomates bacterium]